MTRILKLESQWQLGNQYPIGELEEAIQTSDIVPAVHQTEIPIYIGNPYCNSAKTTKSREAYSPLARGKRLNHPTIGRIAKKTAKHLHKFLYAGAYNTALSLFQNFYPMKVLENSQVFGFTIESEDMEKLNSPNENPHATFLG
jgi:diketogulonate reductase-like aldo/keto reductase